MPFIDDRGRLFGRFNLVDASLAAVLLLLIPAAYGSYLLFRDPVPTLTSVQPPRLPKSPEWQVEIRGAHFRPYLRVAFNDTQGRTFLFVNPTTAVVGLPDLAPGTYDVALYDYTREVARLPKALTVEPPVRARVELDGVIEWPTQHALDAIKPGFVFGEGPSPVEFVAVEAARPMTMKVMVGDEQPLSLPAANGEREIPVRVRTTCAVEPAPDGTSRCAIESVALRPGVTVRFPGNAMSLNLRVERIRSLERQP